jgi:hypothetical protein
MTTEQQNREAFAAFVKKNLGDVAVMDNGRYISPKINNYWILWEESRQRHSAQPAPVHGEATTYAERFTHAVAVLCGAQPPADMVAEWIANIDVNGEHRLQSWVLSQAATPSWAQGIVVLDAAHVLANDPEEGMEHEDRPPVARPVAHQCHWMQTDDQHTPDTYHAPCGVAWTFTEGGPVENDMHFCPKCGNHITQKGADHEPV